MKYLKKTYQNYSRIIIAIVIFLIIWSILLAFVKPTDFIKFVGVKNTYAIAFLVAVCGGVSSLTAVSLFTVLFTFVKGGSNPIILAMISGIGVSIGDSVFYYLGKKGRYALNEKQKSKVEKVKKWATKREWSIPIIFFIYAGFTPFPNDILMVGTALTGTKYRKIIIPLTLGNITSLTILLLIVKRITS